MQLAQVMIHDPLLFTCVLSESLTLFALYRSSPIIVQLHQLVSSSSTPACSV